MLGVGIFLSHDSWLLKIFWVYEVIDFQRLHLYSGFFLLYQLDLIQPK